MKFTPVVPGKEHNGRWFVVKINGRSSFRQLNFRDGEAYLCAESYGGIAVQSYGTALSWYKDCKLLFAGPLELPEL